MEIQPHQQRCFHITLPDDDDFNLVVTAIPNPQDERHHVKPVDYYHDYFMSWLSDMTEFNSPNFMKDISYDDHILELQRVNNRSVTNVYVTIMPENGSGRPKKLDLKLYKIIKESNIVDQQSLNHWEPNKGQYQLCFHNHNKENHQIDILYDIIILSEYNNNKKYNNKKRQLQKEHFTPLENKLEHCIYTAKSILDELHYMEKRELRMKQKSDLTNNRIVRFSYLSVALLCVVTYVQIFYLKGYFKKKKIL